MSKLALWIKGSMGFKGATIADRSAFQGAEEDRLENPDRFNRFACSLLLKEQFVIEMCSNLQGYFVHQGELIAAKFSFYELHFYCSHEIISDPNHILQFLNADFPMTLCNALDLFKDDTVKLEALLCTCKHFCRTGSS